MCMHTKVNQTLKCHDVWSKFEQATDANNTFLINFSLATNPNQINVIVLKRSKSISTVQMLAIVNAALARLAATVPGRRDASGSNSCNCRCRSFNASFASFWHRKTAFSCYHTHVDGIYITSCSVLVRSKGEAMQSRTLVRHCANERSAQPLTSLP